MKEIIHILLILVTLVGSRAHAQENDYQILKQAAFNDIKLMKHIGDSLLNSPNSKKHAARVYLEYANHEYYNSRFEKSDSLYNKVIKIENGSWKSLNANKARVRKAISQMDRGNKDIAYELLTHLEKRFKKMNDPYNRVDAINSIAQYKFDIYQADSGLFYYRKALDIAIANNSPFQQAYILNNIGLFKIDQGQDEEALEDFKEAYEFAIQANEIRLQATLMTNIGLIFMRQQKHEEALKYFKMLLATVRQSNSPRLMGTAFINIGTILLEDSSYSTAQVYYDSALVNIRMTKSRYLMSKVYNAFGNLHVKIMDYPTALIYADSALKVSEEYVIIEDQKLAHLVMSNALDSMGNDSSALRHYRLYKSLSDSLTTMNKDKVLAEMQAKYDLKDKESELIRTKAENIQTKAENDVLKKDKLIQKAERQNIIFLLVIGLVIVLSASYFWYTRILRKQKDTFSQTLIKNIEDERGRIARDLHDDIGQTLSMLKNRASSSENEDTILTESLSKVIDQTREISRNLYPSYLRKVGLNDALETFFSRLEDASDLTCTLVADDVNEWVTNDQKMHIYRMIQELSNNTIKHAKASALLLKIEELNNELRITYLDNGIGLQSKKELAGIGLMSLSERARIMGGSVVFSSNKPSGLKVTIKIRKLT